MEGCFFFFIDWELQCAIWQDEHFFLRDFPGSQVMCKELEVKEHIRSGSMVGIVLGARQLKLIGNDLIRIFIIVAAEGAVFDPTLDLRFI